MTTPRPSIRLARPDDAESIRAIYEPIVRDTIISFELEPPTAEECRRRIEQRLQTHPWLVAELDQRVVGYAYALPFRTRPAYQWTAEVSVYVDTKNHRQGLGRALYTSLFSALERLGYRTLVAGVALPNPASVALHERMGFEPVGVFKNVGFKFNMWIDVQWFSRSLGDSSSPPAHEPIPLPKYKDPKELLRVMHNDPR